MHLFFVDQYISLDMMAPIIFKISKKNKVFLCNFNKVRGFDNNRLYKFLISRKNIKAVNFSKNYIYLFFINCLLLLPSFFLKKGYRYWKYIWENHNFVSRRKIVNFIKENNIKSISIDESLVEKKRYFLLEISKEFNIPLLLNHGGLHTIKLNKVDNIKLDECTFYLAPNKFPIYNSKLSKDYLRSGKYIQLGSPRFDITWLNILKKIFKTTSNKKNKKVKVALFVRPTSISYPVTLKLLKNLKKDENIEIKLNYKPRDVWPTKCSNINKNEMQSSELIIWSDVVISYASSIILEAICRDKPLIYLNYLQNGKKGDTSWFDDLKFIKKGNNIEKTLKILSDFKKSKIKPVVTKENKKLILKKFIQNSKGERILNDYYYFYKKLSKMDFKNV